MEKVVFGGMFRCRLGVSLLAAPMDGKVNIISPFKVDNPPLNPLI